TVHELTMPRGYAASDAAEACKLHVRAGTTTSVADSAAPGALDTGTGSGGSSVVVNAANIVPNFADSSTIIFKNGVSTCAMIGSAVWSSRTRRCESLMITFCAGNTTTAGSDGCTVCRKFSGTC